MITTRTTFNEVKLYAKKSFTCACGKKVRREKKFYQTLNPFNKNKQGEVKTAREISAELSAEAAAWKAAPEPCTHKAPVITLVQCQLDKNHKGECKP